MKKSRRPKLLIIDASIKFAQKNGGAMPWEYYGALSSYKRIHVCGYAGRENRLQKNDNTFEYDLSGEHKRARKRKEIFSDYPG